MGERRLTRILKMVKTETDGLNLFNTLRDMFGWAGTIFTRDDVELKAERKLTDEEWERIQLTHGWRHLADALCEQGWYSVDFALEELAEKA